MMNQINILYIPTLNCNLNCYYCYIKNKENSTETDYFISMLDFFNFTKNFNNTTMFNIIFHGGEPTLIPISFYEYFVLNKPNNVKCSGLQTNMTASLDYYERLRRLCITPSASILLPSILHKKYRQNLDIFKELQDKKFTHVLINLTKESFNYEKELLEEINYLAETLQLHISFDFINFQANNIEKFIKFLKIRYPKAISYMKNSCVFQEHCSWVTFYGSKFYTCPYAFTPINIFEYQSKKQYDESCKECTHLSQCYGGCPGLHQTNHKTPYCILYKSILKEEV